MVGGDEGLVGLGAVVGAGADVGADGTGFGAAGLGFEPEFNETGVMTGGVCDVSEAFLSITAVVDVLMS